MRKNKNYLKTGILLLGLSLLFWKCQKDDSEIIQAVSNSDFKIEIINLKQIESKNTIASNRLNKIIARTNDKLSNYSAKNIYNTQYNFAVNTDYVKYIEKGNYHSYNFQIIRNYLVDDKIENLLLSLNKEGSYDAYIVQYILPIKQFTNLSISNLNNVTTQYIPIDIDSSSLLAARLSFDCIQNYSLYCPIDGGHFEDFDDSCLLEFIVTSSECGWVGSGGSSGGTSISSGGENDGATDTNGGISGTSSTNNTTNENNTIISTPTVVENLEFIADLDFIQKKRYDANKTFINNFLDENYNSFEAWNFVKVALTNNSIKYLYENFELSKESPYNVDMSQVLDTIALPVSDTTNIANKKFLCTYEKLLTSPTFKNLFVNTFSDNKKFNVKFELADKLTNNANGSEGGSATFLDSTFVGINLTIKLSMSKINSNSSFEVAKTILHESIHAYLDLKMYNSDCGTSLEYINNKTLGEIINEFYDNFKCAGNQSQHDFMFNYMLPTFKQCLSEVKNIFIPESHQNIAESTTISDSSLGINESFNWDTFYYYFSMGGLQESETFKNKIKNIPVENYKYARNINIGNSFNKTFPCLE